MNTNNCHPDNKFDSVQFDFYFIHFLRGGGRGLHRNEAMEAKEEYVAFVFWRRVMRA